jgi:hypothetical protein
MSDRTLVERCQRKADDLASTFNNFSELLENDPDAIGGALWTGYACLTEAAARVCELAAEVERLQDTVDTECGSELRVDRQDGITTITAVTEGFGTFSYHLSSTAAASLAKRLSNPWAIAAISKEPK